MIDLHTHSTASDGSLPPSHLIDLAVDSGLQYLALTDHDTTAGLEAAARQAKVRGIRFIPGIELEITHEDPGIFHLLGLGIRNYKTQFPQLEQSMQQLRHQRNLAILQRMNDDALDVRLADVEALAGGDIISRPHFADLLVQRKRVKTRQEAFDRYLAIGKPYYEAMTGTDFALACDCIHRSGGLAIMAHPLSIYISWTKLAERLAALKAAGLDGLEAWHPGARYKEALRLEAMAREVGLATSAGSDFHGDARPDRRLGWSLAEGHRIPDRFLDIFDLDRHCMDS